MGMTRATVLVAVAMAAALVVAAAGIGAYLAVRQNAPAPTTTVEQPAPEARMVAALHGIDPRAVAGEPSRGPGTAVESTEQVVGPGAAAAADPPAVEASRSPRPPAPARQPPPAPARQRTGARPAPPSPAPAQPRRATPRAPEDLERSASGSLPAAVEPQPEPEPATPAVRRPAERSRRDLPVVEGWKPAEQVPSTAVRNTNRREEADDRDLPPLASTSLDPPTPDTVTAPRPPLAEELLIPVDSVIGLQIDTFVTTDHAEVEDDVQARVTRDVVVSRRVAIPAGSLVHGSVVMVERGGKLKGTARLGVRFHTVVLDDGSEVPIVTETVYREGRSRGRDNAARIGGGAVAGAILGAIFGGGRGAAIGGAAGAAGGTAAAAAGDAEPATLPAGTTLTVRLSRPGSVTVER